MPEDEAPLSVVLSQFSALQGAVAGMQAELDELRAKKEQSAIPQPAGPSREDVQRMIDSAIKRIVIQAATPLRASGGGYNWTLTSEPVLPRVLTGQAVCQGDGTVVFTFQG